MVYGAQVSVLLEHIPTFTHFGVLLVLVLGEFGQLLFASFASKQDEVLEQAFDPAETISETISLLAFNIAHDSHNLLSEPLLFLESAQD